MYTVYTSHASSSLYVQWIEREWTPRWDYVHRKLTYLIFFDRTDTNACGTLTKAIFIVNTCRVRLLFDHFWYWIFLFFHVSSTWRCLLSAIETAWAINFLFILIFSSFFSGVGECIWKTMFVGFAGNRNGRISAILFIKCFRLISRVRLRRNWVCDS